MSGKPLAAAAVLLMATAWTVQAQPAYPPFYPYSPATAAPPSWSFDPYASGLGPCPQRWPGDPPCSFTMQPSYGQPSFWPVR